MSRLLLLSSLVQTEQDLEQGGKASQPPDLGEGNFPKCGPRLAGTLASPRRAAWLLATPPRPTAAEGASGGDGEAGQGLPRAPVPALHLFRARSPNAELPTPAEPPSLRPTFSFVLPQPSPGRALSPPAWRAPSQAGLPLSLTLRVSLSLSLLFVSTQGH